MQWQNQFLAMFIHNFSCGFSVASTSLQQAVFKGLLETRLDSTQVTMMVGRNHDAKTESMEGWWYCTVENAAADPNDPGVLFGTYGSGLGAALECLTEHLSDCLECTRVHPQYNVTFVHVQLLTCYLFTVSDNFVCITTFCWPTVR